MPQKGALEMTQRFLNFIPFIFQWECVMDKKGNVIWEDDASDPGGLTKYGIDKRSHPREDIKNLTKERAQEIYWKEYWEPAGSEKMPAKLGEAVMNCRVNCGPGRVAKILAVSGNSPAKFISEQEAFYHRLVAVRPRSAKYLKGWMNRSRSLRQWLKL